MLSDSDLERLFAERMTPEAGRTLIRKARALGPARDIQRNNDTVRTRYISRKMGGLAVLAESRTVELPAIVLKEKSATTLEYWAQPFTVDMSVTGPNGGRTRVQHTPDILDINTKEFALEEWREERRLLKDALERPHLFHKSEDGVWHYLPAEEHFARLGLTHRLHSADELPRIFVANLHFLEDYSKEDVPAVPMEEERRLTKLLSANGAVPYLALLNTHNFSADHIFQLVLKGIGYVDFTTQRLGLEFFDAMRIFRDEHVCRADQLLSAPLERALPKSAMAIHVGTKLTYDGKELEVILPGTSELLVKNDAGEHSRLPMSLVRELFKGDLVAADVKTNKFNHTTDPSEIIVNSKRLEQALARQCAISDPASSTASRRSISRWKRRTAGTDSPQESLPLLISKYPGNRTPRVCAEVIDAALRAVKEHHNTPGKGKSSISAAYNYHVNLCEELGLQPMGKSSFYEWIKTHEDVRAREGRRAHYQKSPIPLTFDYEHPVHGVLPHEILYIDHTIANIIARGMIMDNLGKPTLTIGVDGATAKTNAMYMSFDPPSVTSVLMLLRDYVRRHGRLPTTIVLDNGAEFHCAALLMFCSMFNIHIRWRRRSKPRDSSMVERMLGVTEQEVLSSMDGNSICLKDPRNVSSSVLPEKFISWTLTAIYGAIEYFLFEHHPTRIHPRFGISPREYEERLNHTCGARSFILVRYDATFKLLTSPHPKSSPTRKIDRRKGVFVDGMFYWNDCFAGVKPNERVEVRREMWCARMIYFCFRNNWMVAQARDGKRLEGRFVHEVEIARRAENRGRRAAAQRDRLSPRASREKATMWIPEIWDSRIREQGMEAYYLYERLGMTEVMPEAKNMRAALLDIGTPLAPSIPLLAAVSREVPIKERVPRPDRPRKGTTDVEAVKGNGEAAPEQQESPEEESYF
jgi:putative transposase